MMIEILRMVGISLLGVLILGFSVLIGVIIQHIHNHIMKD